MLQHNDGGFPAAGHLALFWQPKGPSKLTWAKLYDEVSDLWDDRGATALF